MTLSSDLKARLVKGKVVVFGIGDVKMRDDGVGPYMTSRLHEILPVSPAIKLVNGGTVPELYREEIVAFHPAHLIIVDAADMQAEPGTIKIVEQVQMRGFLPVSSHSLPMTLVVDWIKTELPDVDVFLLAIQPEKIDLVDEDLELAGDGKDFFDAVEEDPLKPFFRFSFTPKVDAAVKRMVQDLAWLFRTLK